MMITDCTRASITKVKTESGSDTNSVEVTVTLSFQTSDMAEVRALAVLVCPNSSYVDVKISESET